MSESVTVNSLPQKSREKYESVYDKFIEWQKQNNITSFSESVLLEYFNDLSKKFKPSTLWSQYSMLKSTINNTDNIDIGSYKKVTAFLKRQSTGFKGKKSRVFTSEEVERFLNTAPDDQYLATKTALIFGVVGACRREELCHIDIEDVNDTGSMAVISIPRTKNYISPSSFFPFISRSFTLIGKFYETFKKYAALRPSKTTSNRFFLNYQHGKCTQQVIGINKFGAMPKQIATFLGLENPQSFTGHSFRRTSATLLADAGADTRHGGWRSNRVSEEYADESLDNKIAVRGQITESVHIDQSASDDDDESDDDLSFETIIPEKRQRLDIKEEIDDGASTSQNNDERYIDYETSATNEKSIDTEPLSFNNCTNVTVHIDNHYINYTTSLTNEKLTNNRSLSFHNCTNVTVHIHYNK